MAELNACRVSIKVVSTGRERGRRSIMWVRTADSTRYLRGVELSKQGRRGALCTGGKQDPRAEVTTAASNPRPPHSATCHCEITGNGFRHAEGIGYSFRLRSNWVNYARSSYQTIPHYLTPFSVTRTAASCLSFLSGDPRSFLVPYL